MSHNIIDADKRSYILSGLFIITGKHNHPDSEGMEIFYCFDRLCLYLISHHNKAENFFFGSKNDWRFALKSKLIKFCGIERNFKITYQLCVTNKIFCAFDHSFKSLALYSFKV